MERRQGRARAVLDTEHRHLSGRSPHRLPGSLRAAETRAAIALFLGVSESSLECRAVGLDRAQHPDRPTTDDRYEDRNPGISEWPRASATGQPGGIAVTAPLGANSLSQRAAGPCDRAGPGAVSTRLERSTSSPLEGCLLFQRDAPSPGRSRKSRLLAAGRRAAPEKTSVEDVV